MKLISLKLENIKSYKSEVIDFSEGINCILGLNGSGKSTIIESIGFGLFNYTSKTATELLRYNENKGVISLTFEAADEKVYTIIRTIRSKSNTVKLIDEETNNILLENVSDVYGFVKKCLNIPKDKSMAKLFEEIIAVPQGMFVNAFLETSKIRKDSFDKLFDLDIYKKLADDTKKITDTIEKQYIFNLEKEKEHLRGLLNEYDTKCNEYTDISKKLEDNNIKEKALQEIKERKEQQFINLCSLKTKKEDLEKDIISLNEQINIIKTNINNNDEQINIVNNAEKKAKDNEYAYHMYVNANENYIDLQSKKQHLIELNNKYNANYNTIQLNNNKIEHLNELILNDKIKLGTNKDSIIKLTKMISSNREQIIILEEQIKVLTSKIIDETKKNEEIVYKNKSNVEYLEGIEKTLIGIEKYDIVAIQNQLTEIKNKLEEIKKLELQVRDTEKRIIKLQNEKEDLNNNLKYMTDGLCPILKQKCLNINQTSLNEELLKRIEICDIEIKSLSLIITEAMPLINQEEKLNEDKTTCELNLLTAQNVNNTLSNMIKELNLRFLVDINEENYIHVISDLTRRYQRISDEYQNPQLEQMKNNLQYLKNQKITNEAQINISVEQNAHMMKENETLEKNILQRSYEMNKFTENNDSLIAENNQLDNERSQYSTIDSKIIECKEVMNKFHDKYEDYIKNKEICNMYVDIYIKQEQLENELKNKNNELDSLIQESNQLNNVYSIEEYTNVSNDLQEININLSAITTTIALQQETKSKLNKELEHLNTKKQELLEVENKILMYDSLCDKYKMMRSVFNNIPKELSEQFRKYISMYASSIYYLISNESIRIEMLDDYEVVLVDLNDETKVKSMKQLSGGEQMSVAIAIRLAMLKQITKVDFYFMDEPTINLDYERRVKLGDVVKDMSQELKQLFVISHDDTFDNITNNTIKVVKEQNSSKVEN